jgi:HSP20 family protein
MRFDPFRDLESVAQMLRGNPGIVRPMAAPMDAYRDGDRLIVHLDLPGVPPESIDLTVEKNVLTVRASRTWEPKEGQEVVIAERPQGTFTRQLFLGDGLDPERVEANYDKGVLTLSVPVTSQALPRKVSITAGSEGAARITADAGAGASGQTAPNGASQPAGAGAG